MLDIFRTFNMDVYIKITYRLEERKNMVRQRFSGWNQLIIMSLIVGLTSLADAGFLSISNTLMFRDQQVIITASMYGLAFTFFGLLQGPSQPFVAQLVKKIGPRNTLIIGSLISIMVGFWASTFITTGIRFVVIYGVIWGSSSVLTSQIGPQTFINSWFYQRRGQAQAISRAIGIAFSMICPYIATYVTARTGGSFRIGWYLTATSSVVALALCFFIKNTPQEYGQTPDGLLEGKNLEIQEKLKTTSSVYKCPIGTPEITVKEAIKIPIFWAMVATSTIGFILHMVFNASFNVHFASIGYSLETISIATALRFLVSILFLLFTAKILDKVEPAYVYGVAFIAFAGACFISATMGNSGNWVIYVTYSLTALVNACLMTTIPTVLANYFGLESFAVLQGFTLLFGGLFSSTSGIITGALADLTGSFSAGYMVYGLVALIGAIIAIFGVAIPSARKYKGENATADSV